jgi:hypothetical protein
MAEWWQNAPIDQASIPKKREWWEESPMVSLPPLPESEPKERWKGHVLPISDDGEGGWQFDITAGLPGAMIDAFKLPGDALSGKEPIPMPTDMTRETGLRVANLAGMGVTKPVATIAGKGAASTVREMAKNFLAQPDNPLTGISKRAVAFARQTFDDPQKQAELIREIQRLGPEATLADVSPEWMGIARGAASRPGQRDNVVKPLLDRDAGRNARLQNDLDQSLGPVRTPSVIERGLQASRDSLSPQYTEAMQGARAVDTRALADRLDELAINLRGPAQANARRVREMLNIPGQDVLDPHPGALFQTRRAIDGMLDGETNSHVVEILSAARRQVDDALAQATPGIKDVDAQFSELMRQSEGLERGRTVLNSGKTAVRPDEFAQELVDGSLPAGLLTGPSGASARVRQGIRADIDNAVGNNANDPAALQRLLKSEGDWNRDKLRLAFGDEAADAALNAIDRETQFYRTAGRVTAGSDTAMANRFGDFLDEAGTPRNVPTDTTLTGAALRGGQKALQTVMRSNSAAKADRFAEALGKLSVAKGADRDRIIQALQAAVAARQRSGLPTESLVQTLRMIAPGQTEEALQSLRRKVREPSIPFMNPNEA